MVTIPDAWMRTQVERGEGHRQRVVEHVAATLTARVEDGAGHPQGRLEVARCLADSDRTESPTADGVEFLDEVRRAWPSSRRGDRRGWHPFVDASPVRVKVVDGGPVGTSTWAAQ